MPQQFYLTADPPFYTPTTWKGEWDKTSGAVDLLLDSTKTTADLTKYTIQHVEDSESDNNPPDASHPLPYRVALARFIGGPLKAQTIAGTVQIMAGVFCDTDGGELYYSMHIWATVGDTDVVRATALDRYSEPVDSLNPWPSEPKGRDMILTAAINGITVEDGDRLVVEVGYAARNATSASILGALYYGTDYYSNGSPDMTRDD
jgi:hypothetical protein